MAGGRDNMWKILNHDAPVTPLGLQGARAAVLQPLPPPREKPNPALESIEHTARLAAAAARANQNRPGFLSPLSNSLPMPLDDRKAIVPMPPPPAAWEEPYPRREIPMSLPQLMEMEQRLAMCERAAKLLPLLDQKLNVLERRQDVEGVSSGDVVRGMQSYVDKLERRVGDLQGLLTRALGEFNELKLRDDSLQRELGEARVYIKRLEGMITMETTSQLQELRARDERNVAIREEGRKQQLMMQDEVLTLSKEVESLRAHLQGMQSDFSTQFARIGSRIEQDEGFLSKMRESEVESIQANSSNFARMRSELMQLQTSIQMLEKAMQEQVLLIRSDGDRVGSRVREVEGLLQATESAAVRKAVSIADGWFKELQRSVAEVTDASRTHANSLLQEVDSRLQNIDRSMNRERQVMSDRIVGVEKNMREMIGLQQVAEEGMRRKLDMSTSDFGAIIEDLRRVIEEKEGKLRHEMEGNFKRVKTYARDLEERFEREQKQLEEVIKAEIKARMASYEKLHRLVNRFTGEFQAKMAQSEKRLKDLLQSQIDRVREETSNLAVEHVLEETMLREEIVDSLQALEKDVFDEVKALSEETRDVFTSLADQVRDVGSKLAETRVELAQTVNTELTSLGSRISTEAVERHEAIIEAKKEFLQGLGEEAKERTEQHLALRDDLTNLERRVGSADTDISAAVKHLGEAVEAMDYNIGDLQVKSSAFERGISNLNKVDHDLHKAVTETRTVLDSYGSFFKDFLKISELDRLAEVVPPEPGQAEGIPSVVQALIAMHRRVEDVQSKVRSQALTRFVTEQQAQRIMQDEGQKITLAVVKESTTIMKPMLEAAREGDRKFLEEAIEQRMQRHLEHEHQVWPPNPPAGAGPSPNPSRAHATADATTKEPSPTNAVGKGGSRSPLVPAPSPSFPETPLPSSAAVPPAPAPKDPPVEYGYPVGVEEPPPKTQDSQEAFEQDNFGGGPPLQVIAPPEAPAEEPEALPAETPGKKSVAYDDDFDDDDDEDEETEEDRRKKAAGGAAASAQKVQGHRSGDVMADGSIVS